MPSLPSRENTNAFTFGPLRVFSVRCSSPCISRHRVHHHHPPSFWMDDEYHDDADDGDYWCIWAIGSNGGFHSGLLRQLMLLLITPGTKAKEAGGGEGFALKRIIIIRCECCLLPRARANRMRRGKDFPYYIYIFNLFANHKKRFCRIFGL